MDKAFATIDLALSHPLSGLVEEICARKLTARVWSWQDAVAPMLINMSRQPHPYPQSLLHLSRDKIDGCATRDDERIHEDKYRAQLCSW